MSNLIQDVFAGSTQDNSAGFRLLTVHQVREVLIANLADLKQATACSNISLLQLICPVADGGSTRPAMRGGGTNTHTQGEGCPYLAIRLLSLFLTRLMAVTLFFTRKCCARSAGE